MKTRKFRVWIEQVNQTYVDVSATDLEQAKEKAVRKWRRHHVGARISDVKEVGACEL